MKIEKPFCCIAGGLFGFMLINLSSINKIETICQDPYCLGVPLSKKKKGAGFSLQSSLPQTSGREGFTLQSLLCCNPNFQETFFNK